jgi:hypothetical protein
VIGADIASRLAAVRAAIPAGVTLVAASKGQPPAAIAEAYAAGQRDFGENYAQEMTAKRAAVAATCPDIRWHFIGRVQPKNAKAIAAAHLVHGVGSVDQARALARRADASTGRAVAVLLQVNLEAEESKNGFSEAEIRRDLPVLIELPGLAVRGLMAMPPPDVDPAVAFARVRTLRDSLRAALESAMASAMKSEGASPQTVERFGALSMGMSGDYRIAIREGATLVRVGTAIFGPRPRATQDVRTSEDGT